MNEYRRFHGSPVGRKCTPRARPSSATNVGTHSKRRSLTSRTGSRCVRIGRAVSSHKPSGGSSSGCPSSRHARPPTPFVACVTEGRRRSKRSSDGPRPRGLSTERRLRTVRGSVADSRGEKSPLLDDCGLDPAKWKSMLPKRTHVGQPPRGLHSFEPTLLVGSGVDLHSPGVLPLNLCALRGLGVARLSHDAD